MVIVPESPTACNYDTIAGEASAWVAAIDSNSAGENRFIMTGPNPQVDLEYANAAFFDAQGRADNTIPHR